MTYAQSMNGDSGYRSARGRATAIQILTAIQLVVLAVAVVLITAGFSRFGEDNTLIRAAGGLEVFSGLLYVATFVVFMTWVYRAVKNLPALGSMSCRFTPGGAVWSFIIPILQVVRGHQVMSTVWRESQPPAVDENGFFLPRSSAVVNWWWGMCVVMVIGDRIMANWHPMGIEDARGLLAFDLMVNLITLASGALFLFMVRLTQARQDAQWQDLELRRNVPQPTADALR